MNTAGCQLSMEDIFSNKLGFFYFLFCYIYWCICYFYVDHSNHHKQQQQHHQPDRDLEEDTTCGSGHGYYRERGEGGYHNIMAKLYATDIPGFTNFMRMTPEFFEMIKTRLEPRLARQATNYRAPISVGEKLALTIRYLATEESYTSLSCQFRVGRSTISKFLPEVCRAIQDEFTWEYLRCLTTPDEWKELETEFRIRWNVPHALGALDGKHVALKKPKNSGALYHNYKGFFSTVMLALVDGQYKFRWVDVGTAGSCSDAQIFNTCHLKRKIDDGSIGFPDPAPITQGGQDVPYFILADDATLWQKDVNQRGKDCQLQNIKGQESCWECFWHPSLKI